MILVVGVGRSGTSLVQSMLASHPEVAFGPETSIFRRLVASKRLWEWLRVYGPDNLGRALGNDPGFRRTGLSTERVIRRTCDQGSLSAGAIYRSILCCTAEDARKNQVGDKDPRAIEWIGLVPNVADAARVVHVVRDPRDVVVSKTGAAWSRQGSFIKHLFANRVQIKMALNKGPSVFGSRYHIVVYEKLLTNPEQTLEELCHGLLIPYSEQMLQFSSAAQHLISADESSWKKETLGPLLSRNVGKWKTNLSPYQVALTEAVCSYVFDRFGYERTDSIKRLGVLERIRITIWNGIVAVADPVYRCYRSWRVRRARRYV